MSEASIWVSKPVSLFAKRWMRKTVSPVTDSCDERARIYLAVCQSVYRSKYTISDSCCRIIQSGIDDADSLGLVYISVDHRP